MLIDFSSSIYEVDYYSMWEMLVQCGLKAYETAADNFEKKYGLACRSFLGFADTTKEIDISFACSYVQCEEIINIVSFAGWKNHKIGRKPPTIRQDIPCLFMYDKALAEVGRKIVYWVLLPITFNKRRQGKKPRPEISFSQASCDFSQLLLSLELESRLLQHY